MIISPKNKSELIESLKSASENTFLLAGGTDLIIKLNNSKITDYNLIDITKIDEFKNIEEDEKYLKIGALVTMTDILESKIIKRDYKALYRASYELGSTIIRNRATIGGNICNASQSADCSLVLFAYSAKVNILSKDGEERLVDISDFVTGREKTILKPSEAVTEILIPKRKSISTFVKVGARKAVTISKLSCAIDAVVEDSRLKGVKFFLGAVGVKPVEAVELREYLEGKSLDEIDREEIDKIGFNEVQNAIPNRPSRFYKREAIQGLIEDLLVELRAEYERI